MSCGQWVIVYAGQDKAILIVGKAFAHGQVIVDFAYYRQRDGDQAVLVEFGFFDIDGFFIGSIVFEF